MGKLQIMHMFLCKVIRFEAPNPIKKTTRHMTKLKEDMKEEDGTVTN